MRELAQAVGERRVLPGRGRVRLADEGRALAAGAGVLLAAGAGYILLLVAAMRVSALKSMVRALDALPADLQMGLDLALVALAGAVAARVYRGRQAAITDRQDSRCRICRHDLKGTPTTRGTGRCPECGAAFARFGS